MNTCNRCGGNGRKIVKVKKIALTVSRMGKVQGLPPFIVMMCDNCHGRGRVKV